MRAMQAVRSSFSRAKSAGFPQHFYKLLLAASPVIRSRFRNTNFAAQEALLVHGVYSLLDYAEGKTMGIMALDRLSSTHGPKGLDITRTMYAVWLDCFVEAIRATDPECNEDLVSQWRRTLSPALERLGRPPSTNSNMSA